MKYFQFFERYGAEVVTALGVGAWGLILLNPCSDSFGVFSSSLQVMGRHATENQWGAFALIVGAASVYGMVSGNKIIRIIGLSSALAYRTFTLLFVGIQTNGTSTGMGDFALWCLIALYALYRVSNDA